MRLPFALIMLLGIAKLIVGQQCRYVIEPDCSNDDSSVTRTGGLFGQSLKGEKGDRGFSGKLGPKGSKGYSGAKGSRGMKGLKGECGQVDMDLLLGRLDGE